MSSLEAQFCVPIVGMFLKPGRGITCSAQDVRTKDDLLQNAQSGVRQAPQRSAPPFNAFGVGRTALSLHLVRNIVAFALTTCPENVMRDGVGTTWKKLEPHKKRSIVGVRIVQSAKRIHENTREPALSAAVLFQNFGLIAA